MASSLPGGRMVSASPDRSDAPPENWSVIARPRRRIASWCSGSTARMSRQIDSASSGSFSERYSSTLETASGILLFEIGFNLKSTPVLQLGKVPQEIASDYGSGHRSSIAENRDHLVQMLDLQAVVE